MDKKLFYEEQVELLSKRDAAALVDAHYADDAEMIIVSGDSPLIVKGKDELKKLFAGYIEYVYRGFISTEKFASTDDSIVFEATIDTVEGERKIYDSLYLVNDKIFRHYSGVK